MLSVRGFLDRKTCALVRNIMASSAEVRSRTLEEGEDIPAVRENIRKGLKAEVSESVVSCIKARILELKYNIGMFFHIPLTDCENPHFLVYRQGNYFKPHQDQDTNLKARSFLASRLVSIVIFLNEKSWKLNEESYSGGELILYGLLERWHRTNAGIPLHGEEGTMVAFRSNVVHEVRPVLQGVRYTIVSWFH